MTAGVATTLLSACTLGGVVRADYVVLEVDECWSRFIFAEIPVDYYLVLNLLLLFRIFSGKSATRTVTGQKIREYIGMKERQDAGISPLTCLISYL